MQVNNKLCMHTYQGCYRRNYRIEFVVKSSKINNIMYIKLKSYHPYFVGLLRITLALPMSISNSESLPYWISKLNIEEKNLVGYR